MGKKFLFAMVVIGAFVGGLFLRPYMPYMPRPAVVAVDKPSACLPVASKFKEGRKEAERYMRSKDRRDCYEQAWPAAEKVAKALIAGKLGATERYDDLKKPLKSSYKGWGGIETTDKEHTYFAWVWWQDGRADLNKGVKAIGIKTVHIDQTDPKDPYNSTLSSRDGTDFQILSLATYGNTDAPHFHSPTTVAELIADDHQVLDKFAVQVKGINLN